MPSIFNNRLRQVILLGIILLLAVLLLKQLVIFLPGFLGAITLYILYRDSYFKLTIKRKWNKTLLAILLIVGSIFLIALPLYFSVTLITNKTKEVLSSPVELMMDAKIVGGKIYELTGYDIMTDENIQNFQKRAATIVPALLNSSANILSNFAILFFLLYFMF